MERSVDLYFPQQLEEVDGVFREMQVFHGVFFFIMTCVISCFFNPFHQFPHCLWLDSKLSKMGIEVWTLDFTNSTIRGSIGKLMQHIDHIAGHSHCALIRQIAHKAQFDSQTFSTNEMFSRSCV